MGIFSWFGQGKATAEPVAPVKSDMQPAVTPEAAAQGLLWEMPVDASRLGFPDAVLWHEKQDVMPLASVSMEGEKGGKVAEVGTFTGPRGSLQDSYPTLEAGMVAAEAHVMQELEIAAVRPEADASESYYAKLAALAESRGADMDRDISGDGFDVER